MSKRSVALGSIAPWSPGHVVAESEFLLQKVCALDRDNQVDYILFPGNVSTAFSNVYGKYFLSKNINIIHDTKDIIGILSDTKELENNFIPVSLAHSQYLSKSQSQTNHGNRILPCRIGIEQVSRGSIVFQNQSHLNTLTQANQFSTNYYQLHEQTALPRVEIGLLPRLLPQIWDKKISLINIRTHSANNSFGLNLEAFKPLIAYLQRNDYIVIDVSHEAKQFKQELEDAGAIAYWAIPEKSFLTDLELFSKASVYIGGGGISQLALAYRVPMLWISTVVPVIVPGFNSVQLPCRLRSRLTGATLTFNDAFRLYTKFPDPWDEIYDDFTGKWGPGNPLNCITRLKGDYFVDPPPAYNVVEAFKELEYINKNDNDNKIYYTLFDSRDLHGKNFISMKVADCF
jgi:hypothetical protein